MYKYIHIHTYIHIYIYIPVQRRRGNTPELSNHAATQPMHLLSCDLSKLISLLSYDLYKLISLLSYYLYITRILIIWDMTPNLCHITSINLHYLHKPISLLSYYPHESISLLSNYLYKLIFFFLLVLCHVTSILYCFHKVIQIVIVLVQLFLFCYTTSIELFLFCYITRTLLILCHITSILYCYRKVIQIVIVLAYSYGVAAISRLLQIVGLFCKRALLKRLYSAKETCNFKDPTNRSHPTTLFCVDVSILENIPITKY